MNAVDMNKREKMMDKIAALFRLAENNPSQEEAEAALIRAIVIYYSRMKMKTNQMNENKIICPRCHKKVYIRSGFIDIHEIHELDPFDKKYCPTSGIHVDTIVKRYGHEKVYRR